jgi:hypothetical protein
MNIPREALDRFKQILAEDPGYDIAVVPPESPDACGEADITEDEDGNSICPLCGVLKVIHCEGGDVYVHNELGEKRN